MKIKCQKLAPVRGHEEGKQPENKNYHLQETKKTYINNLNLKATQFIWVGAFVAVVGFLALLNTPRVQAANVGINLELAQQVIASIAPVISETKVDNKSASLVFAPDGYLSKPLVAETKITKSSPVISKTYPARQPVKASKLANLSGNFQGNSFPFGYCTYYVAIRRPIYWRGNAITWLSGARAYGFETGDTPRVGAIVVTAEGGKTGHVAMVDAVNGDQITLTEMNFSGFGVVSSRTISSSYSAIRGYIY